MNIEQLFLSLLGVIVTVQLASIGFLKYYIDAKIDGVDGKLGAKIDSISKNVDMLVQYMISHEGKIVTLEEKVRKLEEK